MLAWYVKHFKLMQYSLSFVVIGVLVWLDTLKSGQMLIPLGSLRFFSTIWTAVALIVLPKYYYLAQGQPPHSTPSTQLTVVQVLFLMGVGTMILSACLMI